MFVLQDVSESLSLLIKKNILSQEYISYDRNDLYDKNQLLITNDIEEIRKNHSHQKKNFLLQ